MIPAYITSIHLESAFHPYCYNIDPFLLHSSSNEHIVDSETLKISGFVTPAFGQIEDADLKFFEILNSKGKSFSLMQIDHAIINTTATSKCDCAIIDDTWLDLIEFKANAQSDKPKTIRKNYKKAMKQLQKTLKIIESSLAASGHTIRDKRTIEAFVSFRKGYPRTTSSEMAYRTTFATRTRGIPLFFDGKKTI